MNLESFLYSLHFETEKLFPADWHVDWEDAPFPYKIYRGLPEIRLPFNVQFSFERKSALEQPKLKEIGSLLWYVYGITQYTQSKEEYAQDGSMHQSLRRFVPSGGALYPNEVYVYLKLAEIPEGIYHYSNAHHSLVLLREGNFDSVISDSIGNSRISKTCFGIVFISTMFWKNYFKYNDFAYRLQGLDAGAVIGQLLAATEKMGFATKVRYQFLDQPLNYLLGFNEIEESVYAVVSLFTTSPNEETGKSEKMIDASDLKEELPELNLHFLQRSKKIIDYPMIKKLNKASMLESTNSFVKLEKNKRVPIMANIETIMLPFTEPLSCDFTTICQQRYSPAGDFIIGKVNLNQLSSLLKETFLFPYENDLETKPGDLAPRYSLNVCIYGVEGVPDGSYFYDHRNHTLNKISSGDFRGILQMGLTMDNINLFQVPLCFHILGDKNYYRSYLGYRGYRIQQMEAGILMQRLLLVASALGLAGHPLLGFDAKSCDELYQTNEKTSLIQIPVGHYHSRAWLKGYLQC